MAAKNAPQRKRGGLTEDQAKAIIRRVAAGERSTALAKEYKVSTSTISRVVNGQTWTHLERPPSRALKRATKLTPEQVATIKVRLHRGDRLVDIARDHLVSGPAIAAIRDGRTWAEVHVQPSQEVPSIRRRVWER